MVSAVRLAMLVARQKSICDKAWAQWESLFEGLPLKNEQDVLLYGRNLLRDFSAISVYCVQCIKCFSKDKTVKENKRIDLLRLLELIESEISCRMGTTGGVSWPMFIEDIETEALAFNNLSSHGITDVRSATNIRELMEIYIAETKRLFEFVPEDVVQIVVLVMRQMSLALRLGSMSIEARMILNYDFKSNSKYSIFGSCGKSTG